MKYTEHGVKIYFEGGIMFAEVTCAECGGTVRHPFIRNTECTVDHILVTIGENKCPVCARKAASPKDEGGKLCVDCKYVGKLSETCKRPDHITGFPIARNCGEERTPMYDDGCGTGGKYFKRR